MPLCSDSLGVNTAQHSLDGVQVINLIDGQVDWDYAVNLQSAEWFDYVKVIFYKQVPGDYNIVNLTPSCGMSLQFKSANAKLMWLLQYGKILSNVQNE